MFVIGYTKANADAGRGKEGVEGIQRAMAWSKQQLAKYLQKQSKKPLALWRTRVLGRDNHICRQCSEPANVAHHIQSKNKYPHLKVDDDNGLSLCEPCHNILHRDNQRYNFSTGEIMLYA